MTPGLKTREELTDELGITSWFASSGNGKHIHSAIVNVRQWHDRRFVKKVYVYFDYTNDSYVMEGAR